MYPTTGTPSHRHPHRCLRSLFSHYNSPRKVTSEMHTSCSYSLRAPSLQRSHLGSRPPLTDCSGVGGDGTNPPGCLRGMHLPCLRRDLRHAWLPGPRDPAVLHGRRAPRLWEGSRYVSEMPAFPPRPSGCSQNTRSLRHSESCADGDPFECLEGIK